MFQHICGLQKHTADQKWRIVSAGDSEVVLLTSVDISYNLLIMLMRISLVSCSGILEHFSFAPEVLMRMIEHEHEHIKHRYVKSVWWDGGYLMVRKNQSEPL